MFYKFEENGVMYCFAADSRTEAQKLVDKFFVDASPITVLGVTHKRTVTLQVKA